MFLCIRLRPACQLKKTLPWAVKTCDARFYNCLSFNLINKNLHQKKIKQRKYVAAQLHYITRWDMFWPSTSFSFLKFIACGLHQTNLAPLISVIVISRGHQVRINSYFYALSCRNPYYRTIIYRIIIIYIKFMDQTFKHLTRRTSVNTD